MISASSSGSKSPGVSLDTLLAAGLVVQIASLMMLWGHTSDTAEFLGRYSGRYALALTAGTLWSIGWFGVVLQRRKIVPWLERIPPVLMLGTACLSALALVMVWLIPVEGPIRQFVMAQWLLAIFTLLFARPDGALSSRRWLWALGALIVALLVPLYISTLADRRFEPDEAAWADRSEAIFSAGGLYTRTYYWPPSVITPGYGWAAAVYGWLLHNVSFSLEVGRAVMFLGYIAAVMGIGAAAGRLYGTPAALICVVFAVLSQTFFPFVNYRSILQMPIAAMLVMFAALQARHRQRSGAGTIWHTACGLLGVLSLEIHASGIIYAFGFSLFYLAEYVRTSFQLRRLAPLHTLIAYGLGAALGCGLFYVLNIIPVGGLDTYLDRLNDYGLSEYSGLFPFLRRLITWPSLTELLLIGFSLVYVIWRRGAADRLWLGIVGCVLIGAALFDTQGYLHTLNAFFIIPVGALLADGLRAVSAPASLSRRTALGTLAVTLALGAQMTGQFMIPSGGVEWMRTGQAPPFLYTELRPILSPYLRPDDRIVSTHQLIWAFPQARLVSHAAGGMAVGWGGYAREEDVWREFAPTVIVYVQGQMHFDPGLQRYMDSEGFVVCEEWVVMERDVRLYRPDCDSG